jgi:hypothetical protein
MVGRRAFEATLRDTDPTTPEANMRPSKQVALIAAVLAASVGAQGQTVTFRTSYWIPPTSPPAPHLEDWAKQIGQASGESLVIQTFPAAHHSRRDASRCSRPPSCR